MRFDIITIFPRIFDSYLQESIVKRAQEKSLIEIGVHNLRDWAEDTHKTVDDSPYGGGPGMVIKIEPVARAVGSILKSKVKSQKLKVRRRIVLFSAKGKQLDAKKAQRLSKYDQLILICGRYEGVDERVAQYVADEEISVGPYVLSGGELAAMIVVDAVSRHIPGVLGKGESLEEKRYGVGVPVYTRPEAFEWRGRRLKVPKVLLSGDHKRIEEWRARRARISKFQILQFPSNFQ